MEQFLPIIYTVLGSILFVFIIFLWKKIVKFFINLGKFIKILSIVKIDVKEKKEYEIDIRIQDNVIARVTKDSVNFVGDVIAQCDLIEKNKNF